MNQPTDTNATMTHRCFNCGQLKAAHCDDCGSCWPDIDCDCSEEHNDND